MSPVGSQHCLQNHVGVDRETLISAVATHKTKSLFFFLVQVRHCCCAVRPLSAAD